MSEPAFLVEGFLEKEFIKVVCRGGAIRRLEINGDAVAIEAIVNRIETLVRLLGNRYHPIVVLFDREGRAESSEEIAADVLDRLQRRGVPGQFIVGIPDRMIENWILADRKILQHLDAPPEVRRRTSFEGENGKAWLKRCLQGKPYRETLDGVALLRRAVASSIKRRSASFNSFSKGLALECFWLNR